MNIKGGGGTGIPFTENGERDILHREAKIFILGILMYPGYPNGHDEQDLGYIRIKLKRLFRSEAENIASVTWRSYFKS